MQTGSKWTFPVPIWVSRETGDGVTSKFTVPMWLFLLIGLVVLLNVLLWGGIGLVEAVQYIL